jgi:hypothetical protein
MDAEHVLAALNDWLDALELDWTKQLDQTQRSQALGRVEGRLAMIAATREAMAVLKDAATPDNPLRVLDLKQE